MNTPLLRGALAHARHGLVFACCLAALAQAQSVTPAAAPATSTTKKDKAKDNNKEEPQALEKFEVTGSRIKRVDAEGPSPIKIITFEEMELTGRNSLTEIMREIPEATALGINEGGTTTAVRGASALDLRNLGSNNTLVLMDGRRLAPNGINSGGTVFVDLNRIPNSMIERVEVLKDGASAIYGADATAGVVNIITRKNFTGAEISARYGNYFRTDGGEQTYSFLGGIAKDKFHGSVNITYSSRHANAAVDEDFSKDADQTERWRAYDAVKYAADLMPTAAVTSSFDFRSTTGPYATVGVPTTGQLTANGLTTAAIRNPLTGQTSTFLPGTGGVPAGTLGSSSVFASVPRGNNPAKPTAAQFVARAFPAGEFSNSYNFQPFVWNVPKTDRRSIAFQGRYDLASWATFYGMLSHGRIVSETHLAPSPISTAGDNSILVPASNYYNPFGIPVAFTYRPIEVGPRIAKITSTSHSYTAGFNGTFRHKFDWDVGWSYSTNDSIDETTNAVRESAVRAALARSTPDALNIFGGPTFKNDPATIEGIRVKSFKGGNATTELFDARASTAELARLPWGAIGAAGALEYRIERFNEANDALSTTLDDIIGQVRLADATRAQRDVQSVSAEMRVPLVQENHFRWMQSAEITGAGRFEKFSDGYDSGVKPYAGIRIRPTRNIVIRASYSGVFRAPTLPQLYGGVRQSLPSGLPDLRRPQALTGDPFDGSATQRLLKAGGNANLLPENGRTKQIGMVVDIPWKPLKGLSFDYTHGVIQQNGLITSGLGTTFIRQNELTSTGDLIVRDATSESYRNNTTANINVLSGPAGQTTPVAPGQTVTVPGRIQYILDSAVNLASQIVRYDDYGVRYSFRSESLGQFRVSSSWTYYAYYSFHRFATDPWVSSVGRSLPRYRGQSSVVWFKGPWGASASMTYIHRHRDFTRDGWEVRRYYTVGTTLSYAPEPTDTRAWLKGTRITLGVDNLLDRNPPLDYTGVGYDQGLVPRPGGRFWFVQLRKAL